MISCLWSVNPVWTSIRYPICFWYISVYINNRDTSACVISHCRVLFQVFKLLVYNVLIFLCELLYISFLLVQCQTDCMSQRWTVCSTYESSLSGRWRWQAATGHRLCSARDGSQSLVLQSFGSRSSIPIDQSYQVHMCTALNLLLYRTLICVNHLLSTSFEYIFCTYCSTFLALTILNCLSQFPTLTTIDKKAMCADRR